ncbi:MAG: HlyD family efflux transporter periplasmic adaptor subunit [Burkholderiales bacterium]|nr:HlyD family efflux transporter periplasmic adaptor subunit [Burkholderiales bacterium]
MSALAPPPRAHAPAAAAGDGTAARVLGLQAALLSHHAIEAAAAAFAAELADALRCDLVCVGLVRAHRTRVLARSDGNAVTRSAGDLLVEAAMNESLDQARTVVVPEGGAPNAPITQAHRQLAAAAGTAACSVPLVSAGRIAGIITLERIAPFNARELALCEDAACFAGPVLELRRRADRTGWERLREWLRAQAAALRAPGHTGARLAALALLTAVAAALSVPLPYRVSAPARIEGAVQRAIAAPADGFLQRANARAGDSVRAGQVLAELASEDLALEQRRRASELRQHENAYRGAMARADRAQMVIHQARAGEAQAMLDLIETQIERTRIVAPFDGVVIKGDLAQNLGAPVQKGEMLLTVAPADSFRLIVEVDDADVGHVAAGSAGRLVLAAAPEHSLGLTVARVLPVATSADGRNYFEVEAALDAPAGTARPGLRGVAKIDAGRRPLAWMATRRALDWLRLTLWAWLP